MRSPLSAPPRNASEVRPSSQAAVPMFLAQARPAAQALRARPPAPQMPTLMRPPLVGVALGSPSEVLSSTNPLISPARLLAVMPGLRPLSSPLSSPVTQGQTVLLEAHGAPSVSSPVSALSTSGASNTHPAIAPVTRTDSTEAVVDTSAHVAQATQESAPSTHAMSVKEALAGYSLTATSPQTVQRVPAFGPPNAPTSAPTAATNPAQVATPPPASGTLASSAPSGLSLVPTTSSVSDKPAVFGPALDPSFPPITSTEVVMADESSAINPSPTTMDQPRAVDAAADVRHTRATAPRGRASPSPVAEAIAPAVSGATAAPRAARARPRPIKRAHPDSSQETSADIASPSIRSEHEQAAQVAPGSVDQRTETGSIVRSMSMASDHSQASRVSDNTADETVPGPLSRTRYASASARTRLRGSLHAAPSPAQLNVGADRHASGGATAAPPLALEQSSYEKQQGRAIRPRRK
jgi:hypothetical protein